MTEDEAKIKQCCGPDGCGHFNDQPYPARWCVAGACMGWRRTPVTECALSPGQEENWIAQGWRIERNSTGVIMARMGGGGYCGLAGAPQ